MDNRPIAIFDSGLGGLSVWAELRRGLTNESLIYYGDGKNCPYGGRKESEIFGFVESAARFMVEHDAKLIVLACNTATAVAIEKLRAEYPTIPFVGLEPAVKPAALNSKSGVIGILATKTSLSGSLFRHTSAKYSSMVEIISAVGEGFVEIVEGSMEQTPEARAVVAKTIAPMIGRGVDHIVLGCTHYPFLTEALKSAIADRDIKLVNPSPAIRRRVESLLKEGNMAASTESTPRYDFYTNGGNEYREKMINKSVEALRLLNTHKE